jgi:pilus assembly protein CpaE
MRDERRSYIVVSDQEGQVRWLTNLLRDEGEVIVVDSFSPERVVQVVDVTGAPLVFVGFSREDLRQQTGFLEGLATVKPLLPVIAVAESLDQGLLLAALRSGVRDFITQELRAEEALNIIRVALTRAHSQSVGSQTESGWAAAVISARPGSDAPTFSLHLALAIQAAAPQNKTLLLDLGAPSADTLLFLGVKSSYTFVDAIRSIRRLDATLIDTAFGKHKSGLHLLAMPEDPRLVAQDITSADVYVLLGTLRRYFTHVVINLGGVPVSDFLFLPLGRVDRVVLIAEQSLPSCKQNLALLQHLRENKINLSNAGLVVDHYIRKMPPDAESVAKGMDLPLLATLPSSGMARLAMMNSGESIFDAAPRDPYGVAVRRLASELLVSSPTGGEAGSGLLDKMRAWLPGGER